MLGERCRRQHQPQEHFNDPDSRRMLRTGRNRTLVRMLHPSRGLLRARAAALLHRAGMLQRRAGGLLHATVVSRTRHTVRRWPRMR
jgi:hypothetical protein